MSEETTEEVVEEIPLERREMPHAWLPVLLGVVACTALLVVSTLLIGQHLKSRPLDLYRLSEETAISMELFLRDHQISPEQIQKQQPRRIISPQAHYYRNSYTVHLSPGVQSETIERLLGQKMIGHALVVKDILESNKHRGISISYDMFPIATIEFIEARLPGFAATSLSTKGFNTKTPTLEEPDFPVPLKPESIVETPKGWQPPPENKQTDTIPALDPIDMDEVDDIELARSPFPAEASPPSLLPPEVKEPKAKLVIIVDDGGYGGDQEDLILALDPKLTLSILPYTPHTESLAKKAHEKGFEVMLHMPMENTNKKNVHEGQLDTNMNEDTITSLTTKALKQVPQAKGINNHTGSKFTADPKAMALFIDSIKDSGLFFIDSKTASGTKAFDIAKSFDIPTAKNDLFLDNKQENEEAQIQEIRKRFNQVVELALAEGDAIAICHFKVTTATVLAELIPTLEARGIELVHASEIVQ